MFKYGVERASRTKKIRSLSLEMISIGCKTYSGQDQALQPFSYSNKRQELHEVHLCIKELTFSAQHPQGAFRGSEPLLPFHGLCLSPISLSIGLMTQSSVHSPSKRSLFTVQLLHLCLLPFLRRHQHNGATPRLSISRSTYIQPPKPLITPRHFSTVSRSFRDYRPFLSRTLCILGNFIS